MVIYNPKRRGYYSKTPNLCIFESLQASSHGTIRKKCYIWRGNPQYPIVDRSLTPKHNSVVVVSLDGQLACKILDKKYNCFRSANPDYPPIPVPDEMDVVIEGVVSHAIHYLER